MEIQADRENKPLLVERRDNIAIVTINRKSHKNAVSLAMWHELAALATELSGDREIRVIVLRGAGDDFCAGADIGEFDNVRRDAATARIYEAANSAAFAAFRNAPIPVVAAIRGICFGGGFGLAAACDLRIATPDALFSVPAAKLGLAYPHDAMADIVHASGPQMAKYLAFSGARIDAQAALAAGFLLEIVETAKFEARVAMLAEEIAANAPLSNRASKAAIRAVLSGDAADAMRAKTLGDETFDSADYAEGRAAFTARRKPVFAGR
ncbi:Enoyl-CoA hydratase/carnithine racemase [Mesorhizobium albiziae]|uniref:Enoyl-CoA hydratase/carnithine racemase n=1 Tax=Neomesorhizobium albiziae TaxID=335020 RepID=A0A1I3Z1X6_9HYPH|nr:enoyl-CoA hydratase-related protein [Mesorhizobium albiziae]GLS33126.1 enoyl-CoA hydratase [Mesorhizobium albiziae]SFK38092.1 Enoyl-CoA hydratase/carnithine racemase [Mesorhizobium albiziae]